MVRLYFPYENVYDVANIIDEQLIENDIDNNDRLIIDEDDLDEVSILLEENNIGFDIVSTNGANNHSDKTHTPLFYTLPDTKNISNI